MRCGDGLEVSASEPHREGRNSGRLQPNTLSFIYIYVVYYYAQYTSMISLDREGNEVRGVGGLKRRERPGCLRGAGGRRNAMKQARALRRLKTQPTGGPWRGETPLRLPARAAPRVARSLCGYGAAGAGHPPPRVTGERRPARAPHTPLPPRAPQPRRAAQKGSFPLLCPTECLFPPLKKEK